MSVRNFVVALLFISILSSCKPQQDTLSYFQNIDTATFSASVDPSMFDPKIEPSDELNVTISSLRPGLAVPYNLPLVNPAQIESGVIRGAQPTQATYIVSSKGDITIPVLGEIHVAGLTVDQVADKIKNLVAKDVVDPVVTVKLLNFKINVAGEVTAPGSYPINRNRVSILDALAMAGDLTPYGLRENVLLIREEDGTRKAYKLDLTNPEILQSPQFYLKQNDYIYVAPSEVRNDNAKYNQNNAYKLSVISTVVSGASVIVSLIIALLIK